MLPALFPAPLAVADVSIVMPEAFIAVVPVPPDEMNTEPPCEVVLEPLLFALAEMFGAETAPDATRETGPAAPLRPEASVVIAPDERSAAEMFAAEFTSNTRPPEEEPVVVIEPVESTAELLAFPVAATTLPPEPPAVAWVSILPVEIPLVA